jgi:hypothetical protein
MGCGVSPFQNPCPFDNPIRIKAQACMEVVVVYDLIGYIFASANNFDTHEGPTPRSGRGPLMHMIRSRHGRKMPLCVGQQWELTHTSILKTPFTTVLHADCSVG